MGKKYLHVLVLLLLFTCHLTFGKNIVGLDTAKTVKLGFVLPEGTHRVSVPFELKNNLIVIGVLLNDAIPLRFILDTGVRTTVLTEKTFTDLLNLSYSRKISIPGVGGKKLVDAYVTNNVTLRIQDIVGNGHALIVLEEDLLQLKNYLGSSVHGVFGYELFSRFVVEINYASKMVTFHDPETFKMKRNFKSYDIEVVDTKPYIKANFSLNDTTVNTGRFMVDTGASHSFLIDYSARRPFPIPSPSIYSHLGRGLGGEMYGQISRLNMVSLAPYKFDGVITTFPDSSSYFVDVIKTPRTGTIGGGLLTRFVVVFDYVNSKLYLKKGPAYKKPFEYNLSGLVIRATGIKLDIYEIVEVREGCTAQQAGILAGDKIVSINGQNGRDIKLDELLGLINLRDNKIIRMVIYRNGETLKATFKLKRQI